MPDSMDPLGLTRAQFEVDPRQAAPQALLFDTRKSARQSQLGGELASDLGDGWRSTVVAWTGRREVTQYQAIPVAAQASSSHPGGVIDFDRRFDGVDARVQKFFDRATLTAGVNLERLEEDRRGYENFVGSTLGVMGRLRRDERNTVTSSDAYLQLEADVAPRWQLTAGARASRVEFRSDDRYLVERRRLGQRRHEQRQPGRRRRLSPGAIDELVRLVWPRVRDADAERTRVPARRQRRTEHVAAAGAQRQRRGGSEAAAVGVAQRDRGPVRRAHRG